MRGLSWRGGLIAFSGIIALAAVVLVATLLAHGPDRFYRLPPPAQIAAIVELLEQKSVEEREEIFKAFNSLQMSLDQVPQGRIDSELEPYWLPDRAELADYRQALRDRDFAAYKAPRQALPGGSLYILNAAEFRIRLRDDTVIIMTFDGVAWISHFGVPFGSLLSMLGLLITLSALIWLYRQFRPIADLADAFGDFDPCRPQQALPAVASGTREVRMLMEAMTRQQEKMTDALQSRSILIGGIQHDVRTFATRLRLRIEHMVGTPAHSAAERDISDLISLMNNALIATWTEAGVRDLELIHMATAVKEEVAEMQSMAGALYLIIDPEARDADVLCDRIGLRRIFTNLLDNSMRYGNRVDVVLTREDDWVVVSFDDDGPGIPKEKRSQILQPFKRLDPSGSRDTGSAGLGLAIVERLVTEFKGSLSIEESVLGGARFVVKLPVFIAT